MTTITHTDYLFQQGTGGALNLVPGVWVRLLNNSTAVNYYSTAVTDATSAFTHSAVPGDYSLYTGSAATVVGTPTLRNAHYSVPVTAGDDAVLGSGTVLASGPYTATAVAGGADYKGAVRIDGGKPWYDITHPNYAAPIDGTTDSGVAVNAAMAAASAAGGGVVVVPPTASMNYALSTRLVGQSNVELRGVPGVTFKWTGGTITQMLWTNPGAGLNVKLFHLTDLIFNTQNGNQVTALFLQSWQYSRITNVKCICDSTATGVRIEANVGTDFNNNCQFNSIRDLRVSTCSIALQLSGINGAGPTDQWFFGFIADDIYQTGIRFVKFCDSNVFFGTRLSGTGVPNANWAGVIANDSTTPAVDMQVYNEQFFGLFIDNSAGPASARAIVLNWQRHLHISALFTGVGQGSPGQTIQDNNSQSHWIELISGSGNEIAIFTKAVQILESIQSPTYVTPYTPDGRLGGVINFGILTGPCVVAAPVSPRTGQILTFIFTQDGVGARLVAWNAVFKTAWPASTAANSIATITFIYDGTNWQQIGGQVSVDQAGNVLIPGNTTLNGFLSVGTSLIANSDIRRGRQTPTEAVLVSGVNALGGEMVSVTLTAARVVGAPINVATGQRLMFVLTQGGAGAFAVTWNAVFKKTWSDAGNATGKISTISFMYDGTNWQQDGAQTPYV